MDNRNIESLATELLEHIFKATNSRKTLLTSRSVCRRWHETASSVLGQWTCAPEKKWHPTDFQKEEPYSSVPKWIVMPTPTNLITEVYKSSGERVLEIVAGNVDFPTKALSLITQKRPGGQRTSAFYSEVQESPSVLFEKFGSSLKYLHICGVAVAIGELYSLLRQTPSLQVLKIIEKDGIFYWSYKYCERPEVLGETFLPNLVNLSLDCSWSEKCRWLLEIFSKQLLTLELTHLGWLEWDCVKCPEGFPYLENLKLVTPVEGFLAAWSRIPMKKLKRLSIQNIGDINAYFNFISRFQTTLEELTLKYVPQYIDKERVTSLGPICFQNLRQLNLIAIIGNSFCKFETKLFSSTFPTIETLQLINRSPLEIEMAREYNTRRGHWNISPSLQLIQWLTDQRKKENVESHTFTRPG